MALLGGEEAPRARFTNVKSTASLPRRYKTACERSVCLTTVDDFSGQVYRIQSGLLLGIEQRLLQPERPADAAHAMRGLVYFLYRLQ